MFFYYDPSNFGWLIVEHSFFGSCAAFAAFFYSRVYCAFDTTTMGIMEPCNGTELRQNNSFFLHFSLGQKKRKLKNVKKFWASEKSTAIIITTTTLMAVEMVVVMVVPTTTTTKTFQNDEQANPTHCIALHFSLYLDCCYYSHSYWWHTLHVHIFTLRRHPTHQINWTESYTVGGDLARLAHMYNII